MQSTEGEPEVEVEATETLDSEEEDEDEDEQDSADDDALGSPFDPSADSFNESNEYDFTNLEQSQYTQGVGAFYKQSFNNWG